MQFSAFHPLVKAGVPWISNLFLRYELIDPNIPSGVQVVEGILESPWKALTSCS